MHVCVPADYHETKQAIQRIYKVQGPCYVRCGRPKVAALQHPSTYQYREGKGQLRRQGRDVTIIACGIMVEQGQRAIKQLAEAGIDASLINMASIKPIDEKLIIKQAKQTGAVVTAEEHNYIGGLGSAVSEVLCANYPVPVIRVGMKDEWGQSGSAEELLDHYSLNSKGIIQAVKKVIKLKK